MTWKMNHHFNKMVKKYFILFILILFGFTTQASYLLISMDETQKNHLKAYGIAYWELQHQGGELEWLLNYQGGSLLFVYSKSLENECTIRGVSYKVIADIQAAQIRQE